MSRTSLSTRKQDDVAVNDSSIAIKGKFFNVYYYTYISDPRADKLDSAFYPSR